MNIVSYDELKKQLPKEKRHLLTEDVYTAIVDLHDDSMDLRETLLTYTDVLNSGKYSLVNYAKACKFVAMLNMGKTAYDAYIILFPDRYETWMKRGVAPKDQYSEVTGYKNRKLVSEIMKRTLIPTNVLNQDKVQQAINVLADLMMSAKSEMVRQKSAETLLKELKVEEKENKLELDITVKKDESLQQLEETLNKLAEQQVNAIEDGKADPKYIAEMDIITVESEEK
jgi:hypothetical protein